MGFIEKFDLWTEEQQEAARAVLARVDDEGVRSIRVSFVDQHGLLHGKTIPASGLAAVFRGGISCVSTLLSKDTSGTTVFAAFDADGGLGVAEMAGAADIVMVPDPTTFHLVPWAGETGRVLCDLRFQNGEQVPFCSRGVLQKALDRAGAAGYGYLTGLEIEFHLYRRAEHFPNADGIGRCTFPTPVEPINQGNQLLSDDRGDEVEPATRRIREALDRMGIELRSIEVEYGANQLELTLDPIAGLGSADAMVLLRSTIKQVARRSGYHATFMCRPQLTDSKSSGWHLHQSLISAGADGGRNVFVPGDGEGPISPVGRHFVAGQLAHASAACVFANPTINGYKRFQPYSMAPDRIAWARDNRGAMIRLVGSAEDGTTHLENRIGESAANPYLYMASQLHSGLEGIDAALPLPPSADDPYTTEAGRLPANLREAVDSLEADAGLTRAMGEQFVGYYAAIKRAEIARFERTVTDWEQREYFDLY
ncbi:glutamine synthetase family protein [Pseudonocardia alaniniphila]|uniref:Glutamine synthetase family protein n=1 Tax=Pseudonocardia alaniniphila TaxID=75291 RepID=A0ABS9T944_9PSEU|nr:glutamine synthetase family protein [Pseudonocardia alaniniphila]MCH6165039.1 glutamine synthetase family protein [Pseudonocardia alaniniphila]